MIAQQQGGNGPLHAIGDFFYGALDLRVCALVRIGYAALVLVWLAVLFPDLPDFYSEEGLLPLEPARKLIPGGAWTLLALLPQDPWWVTAAYAMAAAHAMLLLLGFASRLNAAAVFVWVVSFCYRNQLILDGEDAVFRLVGFYLMLMPSGARWSLDAWLARRRGRELPSAGPAWGLRLLQIQMCVIFLSAALCKLQAPAWRDGTAMYYVSRLTDYFGKFPTPDVFWHSPTIVALITWSVVALELAIPLAVWWRPLRPWALLTALLFHLANEYAMHLFLFHWIMLVGWASFLQGRDLDRVRRWFPAARATPNASQPS